MRQPALFTEEDPPQLIGGRDRASGRIVFPDSGSAAFEPVLLARTGSLWSYTIQRFRPKTPPYAGPEAFEPWVLGYVALEGQVIVQARLVEMGFDAIRIGMTLELTRVPLDPAAEAPFWLPAFRPVLGAAA